MEEVFASVYGREFGAEENVHNGPDLKRPDAAESEAENLHIAE